MSKRDELHPLYIALFLVGGLCTGAGIVNLYYAFGAASDLNGDFATIGFTALDNIGTLPAFSYSLPLIIVGVACLVLANSAAWKETDGY
jgi:hypothetical protein